MIVNQTDSGWEIIYHRAHALLAAQLAGHWRRAEMPPRHIETVAAIFHHDDLEREWEGDHLSAAGAPLDFTLGKEISIDAMRKLIDGAHYRGRWVELLVSMHMSFLNEPARGTQADLDQFLDEQRARQKELRRALKVASEEAERAYAFMQWCDRLSLILCQHGLPARERALEISRGPDGVRYDVLQLADGRVTVQPWPFEQDRFAVVVEACHLSQLRFQNNRELVDALQHAPIETLEWTFERQKERG